MLIICLKPPIGKNNNLSHRRGSSNCCNNIHKTKTFLNVSPGQIIHCRCVANNTTHAVCALEFESGTFCNGRTKRRMKDDAIVFLWQNITSQKGIKHFQLEGHSPQGHPEEPQRWTQTQVSPLQRPFE